MEQIIGTLTNPNVAFILSLLFIFGDILSGVLKAWKNKNLNSTKAREGFVGKLGWIVGLLLGYGVLYITGINLMLIVAATACIGTELISILENLADLGVKIPLGKYLEKVDENTEK